MVGRPRNARFWVSVHGDWVKLTLRPDQELEHAFCEPTDEGWHSEYVCWSHAGDRVELQFLDRSRCCDGRYDRGGTLIAALDSLANRKPYYDDDPMLPSWRTDREWQRDHNAEAAGY